MIDKNFFTEKIEKDGMCLVNNIFNEREIFEFKKDLELNIKKECEYHSSKDFKDYGMVLFCAKYGGSFLKIFENDNFFLPFEWILGENCILYSNTSTSMPPNSTNYSNRIHIDVPFDFPINYPLRLLSLIILDDFNENNGATWFLPGSHIENVEPTSSYFYENAKRLTAKAGSVLYWNPKIWHAGGQNNTEKWRHAFTIVMTRYFIKQRINYPNILKNEMIDVELSHKAKRRLGYFSYPPNSYDEYYSKTN